MDKNNPYKGLFPYTGADEKRFFGRDRETSELVEMIKNSQLVVIYGESGTGKTSLIHAKLFPELERQYHFPIYIRINYSSNVPPLEQFKSTVYKELVKWDKDVETFFPGETLIEYAAKTKIFNGLVKPILFFDQFEELFTLGPRFGTATELNEYVSQLSDLIEVRFPQHSLVSLERSTSESIENILNYTTVLSLRQDFVAHLDDLRSQMPSVSNNRYSLKRFSVEQALSAIQNSAWHLDADNNTMPDALDERTARLIINNVVKLDPRENEDNSPANGIETQAQTANDERIDRVGIDPTLLSLYCHQLYEEAFQEGHLKKISYEQVERSPAASAIEHYYLTSLTSNKFRRAVETYLITSDGRRLLFPLLTFIKKTGLRENEVEKLQRETAIFRIYGKDEFREIELAHDQLAKRALITKNKRAAKRIRRTAFVIIGSMSLVVAAIAIVVLMFVKEREATTRFKNLITTIQVRNDSLQQSNYQRIKLLSSLSHQKDLLDSSTMQKSRFTIQWQKEKNALEERLTLKGDSLSLVKANLDRATKEALDAKSLNKTLQAEITILRAAKIPVVQKTNKTEIPKQLSVLSLSYGPVAIGNSLVFKEDSIYVTVKDIDKKKNVNVVISKNRYLNDIGFSKNYQITTKQSITLYYKNHYFIVYCYYIIKKEAHLDLIKLDLE